MGALVVALALASLLLVSACRSGGEPPELTEGAELPSPAASPSEDAASPSEQQPATGTPAGSGDADAESTGTAEPEGPPTATATATPPSATATTEAEPTTTATETPTPEPAPVGTPGDIALVPAFGGREFERPIELLPYPGGRFILAQQNGTIRLLTADGGDAGTVLNLTVRQVGNEEGLLSIALDPAFPARPFLYAYYSADGPRRTVLSRFTIAGDAATASSEIAILEVNQPLTNHNGGAIRFGPDGMLYLGYGDGGGGGDRFENGQNTGTVLASVIRIDVSRTTANDPYEVPPDNPFVGVDGARPEIWAYGLRNPWRMAFDPATGLLWLGDVGQADFEEIDIIQRGGNYGWNLFEGTRCFTSPTCDPAGTVLPVATYGHSGGRCSVTGGYVYRGSALPGLAGHYLFADFCSGELWAMPADLSAGPEKIANSTDPVAAFGLGHDGELYLLTFGGPILRIAPE